jgi:hypothetical protein
MEPAFDQLAAAAKLLPADCYWCMSGCSLPTRAKADRQKLIVDQLSRNQKAQHSAED